MTIRITCEGADLKEFLTEVKDAHERAAAAEERSSVNADKAWSLETKVRDLEKELSVAKGKTIPGQVVGYSPSTLSALEREDAVRQLIYASKHGLKINAIKAVRVLTAMGLKEAKDLVEAEDNKPAPPTPPPPRY